MHKNLLKHNVMSVIKNDNLGWGFTKGKNGVI